LNRLKDLARRQQDVNDRLQDFKCIAGSETELSAKVA